jgi:hypothetical protein
MTSVRDVVAQIIPVPQSDPEAPGPFRYADSNKFLALLERAGFARLDPEEAAHFALAPSPPSASC